MVGVVWCACVCGGGGGYDEKGGCTTRFHVGQWVQSRGIRANHTHATIILKPLAGWMRQRDMLVGWMLYRHIGTHYVGVRQRDM